ncbi:MAG: ketose-bisphosphate aldolase [Bacteroidetes bacterium]|nr:MAG: ketose-bisphosphate aldolase [Bacteroidota bacterium]RLD78287.1 MAG: ketose-bisphosphate aldolase [Bacteroidota bacterium]
MNLQDKFKEFRQQKKALLATNFYNFETLKGIMLAAQSKQSPIILQLTQSSIDYMGLRNAYNMGKTALKYYGVEGWIHLDHGGSIELVKLCLETGFDSVMFDGSELPFEQNIELSKQAVKLAKHYGANVEAELGYVAKLGQSTEKTGFTEPNDAKVFVEQTGVDALAVAIGTAHGFYKEEPNLDFERLIAIKEITNAALVLHGGSGVPHEQIKKAVSLGINKVNIATEIKNTFMETLKLLMAKNDEIDLRKVFPPATDAVETLIKQKLEIVS